jgi:hypothetical protein
MSQQRSFILADYFEPDPYTRFQIADRALNTAIVQAEITRSFEEYLEIFDEFYADDIEVTSDTRKEQRFRNERVRRSDARVFCWIWVGTRRPRRFA